MLKVGDKVRMSESARQDLINCGEEGPHVDVARENRVGTIIKQLGARGRYPVIGFLVDFGGVYITTAKEALVQIGAESTNSRQEI
jgi:hypothetical protein